MSKYILRKRSIGFTTVSNPVIAILSDDLGALGLYIYLLAKPDNWEFYKTKICTDCKIGQKKLEKYLKRLNSHGLVQYGQERNEKGQFERFFLDIYDTETPNKSNVEQKQPERQNCRTVETVKRFGEAIKEEIQKKDVFIKNKEKSSYELAKAQNLDTPRIDNTKRHGFAESMDQMAREKKHIEEHEAVKYSPMPESLRKLYKSLAYR